jgi:hypothetical protein
MSRHNTNRNFQKLGGTPVARGIKTSTNRTGICVNPRRPTIRTGAFPSIYPLEMGNPARITLTGLGNAGQLSREWRSSEKNFVKKLVVILP